MESKSSTLSQIIDEFLETKIKQKFRTKRKFDMANNIFDQTDQDSRHIYGLKQQYVIQDWLERPIQEANKKALAEDLENAISDSIDAYSHNKQTLIDVYRSFCDYFYDEYDIRINFDWKKYQVISDNREWQIIKLSTENMTISNIASKLMVNERQIREDATRLKENGLSFLDRKVKINGLIRKHGRIVFESTPHPILILGNLMQVISTLEALRLYKPDRPSDIPKATARQIWKELSNYAKTTIKKRISDGVYDSDINWYNSLDELAPENENIAFLTEEEQAERNVNDQLMKCYKNSEPCIVQYEDESGKRKELKNARLINIGNLDVKLFDLQSNTKIVLPADQILSCKKM